MLGLEEKMRPEISDAVIERLKNWVRKNRGNRQLVGSRGKTYYTIEDAISDLLKEAGF